MAVNIDTVYQRVLAIANKEQRGYITPQEFNLYANQAQMDIFEQYFYDLNQFHKLPGNDTTYADMVDLIEEKVDHFERYQQAAASVSNSNTFTLPDYYRMGEVFYLANGGYVEIENVTQNEIHHYLNSPLTAPTARRPIYVRNSGAANTEILRERQITVYPATIVSGVTCNYIAKPTSVSWGYIINVTNGSALYNANNTTHFELHRSEESELVIKILELAGIELKDPQLYQQAATEEGQNIQQENK
tara:strand:- start:401 stop:1138 length:738 start_codon:yes stop_codon:yes gene_type:complete